MKLQTTKTAMLAAVNAASRVTASKNALPIFDNVRIWHDDNGNWMVTGGTPDVQATVALQVVGVEDEPQNICMQAVKLMQALSAMPDAPVTIETTDGTNVLLRCGKGKYKMTYESGEEYPLIPWTMENSTVVRVPGSAFVQNVKAAMAARVNDELRPQLSGVAMDIKGEETTFVASDGHKMFTCRTETRLESGEECIAVLPPNVAKCADVLFKTAGEVRVCVNAQRIVVCSDGVTVVTSALEGKYPNYKVVIPNVSTCNTIVVNTKEMLSALQRCEVFANDSSHLVAMSVKLGAMMLESEDMDFSRGATEEVGVVQTDCLDTLKVGFHIIHMIDLLKNIRTENVRFKVSAPNRPIVLLEDDDKECMLELQMPMLIQ